MMNKLKILGVHEYYQQGGGEDTVFASETTLLRQHGHVVIEYIEQNKRIPEMNRAALAIQTVWSRPSYEKILKILEAEKPDLAHFHNTFPLISPSAYYACQKLGIPVIQSLDNPRLMCPAASFYRNGHLCLDCLGRTPPWPAVKYGCYHSSRLQTTVVAGMLSFHHSVGTWQRKVDRYLVASNFYHDLFLQSGLQPQKLAVKPHFILNDPGFSPQSVADPYALFLGRLDPEKGIRTLLEAWKSLRIPLKIRGDGRLRAEVETWMQSYPAEPVQLIERLNEDKLRSLIRGARFLVWPSEGYYETFGLAAVECFAQGIPVIASNIGVMPEIVKDHETGLLFNPANPRDLATKAEWLWVHPEESARMGWNARKEYEEKYTPERNYHLLMEIYNKAINERV